jgi:hypothetical protein
MTPSTEKGQIISDRDRAREPAEAREPRSQDAVLDQSRWIADLGSGSSRSSRAVLKRICEIAAMRHQAGACDGRGGAASRADSVTAARQLACKSLSEGR